MEQSLFEIFGANKEMEVNGVDFQFGSAIFTARRAGSANKLYSATVRKVFAPYRRQMNNDTLDPEVTSGLMMKVFFRSVILGWRGVTDKEGRTLEFNEQNFIWLMTELPDLWETLQENCAKLSNFRSEANEEDGIALGNS